MWSAHLIRVGRIGGVEFDGGRVQTVVELGLQQAGPRSTRTPPWWGDRWGNTFIQDEPSTEAPLLLGVSHAGRVRSRVSGRGGRLKSWLGRPKNARVLGGHFSYIINSDSVKNMTINAMINGIEDPQSDSRVSYRNSSIHLPSSFLPDRVWQPQLLRRPIMLFFVYLVLLAAVAALVGPSDTDATPNEVWLTRMDGYNRRIHPGVPNVSPALFFDVDYKPQRHDESSMEGDPDTDDGPDGDSEVACETYNQVVNVLVEWFAGNDIFTSDLKVSKRLFSDFVVFIRQRTSIDYEDDVSCFVLTDFCYSIYGNLDVVAEIQAAPSSGTIPRVGVQYWNTFGDFYCYLFPAFGIKDFDTESAHIFAYNISLSQKIVLRPQIEIIINLNDGYNFSIGRARLGTKIDKVNFGLAADIFNSGGETEITPGLFLHMEF